MKKLFMTMALMCAVFSVTNAQIATENSKVFDNVGLGVVGGVSTPLDFNSIFPINIGVGVKATKEVTPIFGVQLEGIAIMNSNHFANTHTAIDAVNVNLNLATNLTNAFLKYAGKPRSFEISAITGFGWLHDCGPVKNDFLAKTGLDFAFNLGSEKQHSVVITPAIMWNLTQPGNFKFSRSHAQLGVGVSYLFHFMNSNGTRHFKIHDIGAMNEELNLLRASTNAPKCCKKEVVEVKNVVETTVVTPNEWVVQFAQGSYELTSEAKDLLDTIGDNLLVDVVGTASPEGGAEWNQSLSENRAKAVADYLTNRGLKVRNCVGKGVHIGASTNRLAIVTVAQ